MEESLAPMSLNDLDFSELEAQTDPMKAALLRLQSARRELAKNKTYEMAVQVQLAEKEVNALANIARREIRRVQ